MIVGRDAELARVRALWAAGVERVTICGPAGIGKSALAAALVPDGRPLVTSRVRAHAPGEHVVELGPLADDAAIELLRIWIARTRGVPAGDDEPGDLAAIARAVDGVQGVLVLIARRVAILGAAAVRARLGDPFALLEGLVAGPLRDAIAWSATQLDGGLRDALARLSIFRGAFDLAAVGQLLGVPAGAPDVVQALRERGLLVAADGARFRMLAPVRWFARALVAGAPLAAIAACHDRIFRARAQGASLAALEADREELLAVLERATMRRDATIADAATSAAPLLLARGPTEPLRAALEVAREARIVDPRLAVLHTRLRRHGELPTIRLGVTLRELGRLDEAEARADEAFVRARRRRDAAAEAFALSLRATVASDRDDATRALADARHAVDAAEPTGDLAALGVATSALARAHLARAEHAEAERVLRRAHELLAGVGLRCFDAQALGFLGLLAWARGDLDAARRLLEDARTIWDALEDPHYASHATAALAAIDAHDDLLVAAAVRAREIHDDDDGRPLALAASIHLEHLVLARARRDPSAAPRLRRAVKRAVDAEPVTLEQRLARRILRSVLLHGNTLLEVGASGWRIGHVVVELDRHTAARGLFAALVAAHRNVPGRPLAWDTLVAAGWPGERLSPASARNRLKVAIAWLRGAGLRDVLASDARGYWLRPGLRLADLPAN